MGALSVVLAAGKITGNSTNGILTTSPIDAGIVSSVSNNGSDGVSISGKCRFQSVNVNDNAGTGFTVPAGSYLDVFGGSSSGNTSANLFTGDPAVVHNFRNFTTSETYSLGTVIGNEIRFTNLNGTANNHKVIMFGGTVLSELSVRHTASGISWNLQPTSALRDVNFPVQISLAKVAVASSGLVTANAWMQRDNTGLTMQLMCRGGQIGGVASDVFTTMTVGASTWEQVTITFTPTEAGVVEILAQAYGGTTFNGYVDDFSVSQA
jgi:hypothetical protein